MAAAKKYSGQPKRIKGDKIMKMALIAVLILTAGVNTASARQPALDALNISAAGRAAASSSAPGVPAPAQAGEPVAPKVFKAVRGWQSVETNSLAQLGARKTAEDAALLACELAGEDGVCVATASRVVEANRTLRYVSASAEARAASPVSKAVFSAAMYVPSQRKIYGGFNEVERLGARKIAEEAAVAECRAAGYLACFAVRSIIVSCDSFKCEAQAFAKAFQAK
jgi:hypothetical protein